MLLGKKNGHDVHLPERLREPAAPDVKRNASVIPENWELTKTPSASSESESDEDYDRSRYDRSRYDIPNGTKGN